MKSNLDEIITGNLVSFYERIAGMCGYETGLVSGCRYVWNREGSWPSYILGVPGEEDIKGMAEAIERGDLPAFWILPGSAGREMSLLDSAGIRAVKRWSGMHLDPAEFVPATTGPGLEVKINDPGSLEAWLEIVNTDLVSGTSLGPEVPGAIASSGDFHWMVAYRDGVPLATGLVFSADGVGGLYMLATRASARGGGIGSAVFSEMTALAIRTGNRAVVLHGTGLGERIYLRTGFRIVNDYAVLWSLGR